MTGAVKNHHPDKHEAIFEVWATYNIKKEKLEKEARKRVATETLAEKLAVGKAFQDALNAGMMVSELTRAARCSRPVIYNYIDFYKENA